MGQKIPQYEGVHCEVMSTMELILRSHILFQYVNNFIIQFRIILFYIAAMDKAGILHEEPVFSIQYYTVDSLNAANGNAAVWV